MDGRAHYVQSGNGIHHWPTHHMLNDFLFAVDVKCLDLYSSATQERTSLMGNGPHLYLQQPISGTLSPVTYEQHEAR